MVKPIKICAECGKKLDPAEGNDLYSVKCLGCNLDSSNETAEELFIEVIAEDILKLLKNKPKGLTFREIEQQTRKADDDIRKAVRKLEKEKKIILSEGIIFLSH